MTTYKILTEEGQNLADIAMQEYGHTDGLFYLALDNNLNITDDIQPGTTLIIRADNTDILNQSLINYAKGNAIHVNSGEILPPGAGIGFMIVDTDFQVA